MRDLLILVLLVVPTLWALRRPWIGVITWTVVSLMSPHTQFGYSAAGWPVATGVAVCTLLGILVTKDKQNPMLGAAAWWLLVFVAWITITLPFSIYFDDSYPLWERSMKIYLMVFVTIALLTDYHKLMVFIWANVISIAFYGVKGGIFTILSGGAHRVWGPGGFIEGNNEVALAVITVVPLMRFLLYRLEKPSARLAMIAAIGLCLMMTLGTQSRGALVGIGAMVTYLWFRGENKLQWGVLIVVVSIVGLSLMPDAWWERMSTIKTYEADASAMGRINAWWMAFNLAKDRIFGGGFMVWTGTLFQLYAPVPEDPHAAHSIYFQVMGEHGFIGFGIFVAIGAATWFVSRDLRKIARHHPELRWAGELGAMVQVSMIGYAITGAFLSLAYYDLPYNVMAIALVARKLANEEVRKLALPRRPAPAGAGPRAEAGLGARAGPGP